MSDFRWTSATTPSAIATCSFVAAMLVPAVAEAHAYVVASQPAAASSVTDRVREVRVTFDEPVTIDSSDALDVRDERGIPVGCVAGAHVDPNDVTSIVCTLSRTVRDGTYSVQWRVTSADTHVVHGTFAFGVNERAGSAPADAAGTFDPSAPLASALRWIVLFGTLVACGALLFDHHVIFGSFGMAGAPARTRCRRLALVCACSALAASFPALAVQMAATGNVWYDVPAAIGAALFGTLYGVAWLLRVACLVTLIVLVRRGHGVPHRFALFAGSLALISLAISGHAAGGATVRLASIRATADFLHLAGAAVWVGGLASFAAATDLPNVRTAINAFSPLAVAAVIAIALSGTFASIVHVGSWNALVSSWYGRIVLAKIALLLPAIALGARNFAAGRDAARFSLFERDSRWEFALLTVIVGLSAVLCGMPTPHRG